LKFFDEAGVSRGGQRIGWLRWGREALSRTDEDPMTEERLPLTDLLAKAGMATSCVLWPGP
jgi:hypothetical protein